ncbi:unnamed protein product [Rotaria sp. Silwood1]|nr:unnamed protein product [Rotaria sp. Silwood1]CAF3661577.1 unnamed protein product [Rotaria sp. Silwood1]CAF3779790.1 unnamed protein product [Rotaria sp. Silwood1]CAF4658949.1 unnamed protein product [Rotaria sp. Silwood1]CAF4738570.1 unnamed protein product [Rotaria sp. Silwood1]
MSSNYVVLPNEVVRLILLHCQTSKDYLSQSLVSRQWSCEAHRLKSLMKTRFSRKITLLNYRSVIWNFDIRVTVVGYGEHLQRHGLEECVQTYHRVGGPGAEVYYLERHWQEGKLHGLEIIHEINKIWYKTYYSNQAEIYDEMIHHPYDGLKAVESMKKYGRHQIVPKNGMLPEGCDYLGKIIFKYEWISCTLEESNQIKRNLINKYDQSDINGLYDVIDTIDLYQISLKE